MSSAHCGREVIALTGRAAKILDHDESYLGALVETLLRCVFVLGYNVVLLTRDRFLQSEPKGVWAPTVSPLNGLAQSSVVEILQLIVSRGELEPTSLEGMEAIVIGKLYYCIHTKQLDLQNKLLHLLHSLISVSAAVTETPQTLPPAKHKQDDVPVGSTQQDGERSAATSQRNYPVNPLLLQTLVDGISTRSNRPILQHWMDFALMAVPQFQPALQSVVTPLNDCLCKELHHLLKELQSAARQPDSYGKDIHSSVTDADMIMLLNGLERFVLLSLAHTEGDTSDEESIAEKPVQESGGLLGLVSNVFSSDNTNLANTEQLTVRVSFLVSELIFTILGTLPCLPSVG